MEKSIDIHGPPFELQTSHWDRRFIPIYSNRLLIFPLRDGHQDQIVSRLQQALRATVNEVPFLAGSVVPFSAAQPWLHDIRAEGAVRLEVRDLSEELDLAALRQNSFSPSSLDAKKLCSLSSPPYFQNDPIDVCRVRVTFIQGGLILAFQVSHIACDGRGITNILQILARNVREIEAGTFSKTALGTPGSPYKVDRTKLVCSQGAYDPIENHPCWTTYPTRPAFGGNASQHICAVFRMTADAIASLKSVATSHSATEDGAPIISSHDAITGLIWQSLMRARKGAGILSTDSIVHFATPVDCRSRLQLPEPYFGNVIDSLKVSLALSELLPGDQSMQQRLVGLQTAARVIRAAITSITAETFRGLLGFVERTDSQMLTRLSIYEEIPTSGLYFVSGYHFGVHALDFGQLLGRPESYRLPAQSVVSGVPFLFGRGSDGSAEFIMREPPEVMTELGEDPWFAKFAQRLS